MIYTIFMCALFGIFIMCAFVLGVKIGQTTIMGEKVEIKTPIKAIREYKDTKEIKEQNKQDEIMLHNIDVYDGTSLGQEDID